MADEMKDNVVTEKTTTEMSVESSQAEVTDTEATTETATTETVETKSEAVESATPRQTKVENSFFKHMREKAEKEAQTKMEAMLKEKVDEELKKFKGKLSSVLPDGYENVDDYLNSIDENSTEEDIDAAEEIVSHETKKQNPALDEKLIDSIVAKRLESIPEIKIIRERESQEKERLAKEQEDEAIVRSFEEMKGVFVDIKKPEDVPLEVWGLWNEGNNGRSLISCMKEHRYDSDIEQARKKATATAKGQTNSVAHTGTVNGGAGGAVQVAEEVQVPLDTQTMLKGAGVPREKWAEYYKKYHR